MSATGEDVFINDNNANSTAPFPLKSTAPAPTS